VSWICFVSDAGALVSVVDWKVKIPRPLWNNCPFSTMYLLLRGEVREVWVVRSDAPGWLYAVLVITKFHYLVLTRRGHVVHFRHAHKHQDNPYGPWWFVGQVVGASHRHCSSVLNRPVVARLGPAAAFVVFGLIYAALFVPWCAVWMAYGPYWSLWWAGSALVKRFRR